LECEAEISDQAHTCPRCGAPTQEKQKKRSKIWLRAIGVIVLIPVVLVVVAFIQAKMMSPEDSALDTVSRELRGRMKDPDSMTIRSSFVVTEKNPGEAYSIFVCGVVDGKNGFGGYQGGTRFVANLLASKGTSPSLIDLMLDDDTTAIKNAKQLGKLSPFEDNYWNSSCVDENHPRVLTPSPSPRHY
jgi:hypothetical protein